MKNLSMKTVIFLTMLSLLTLFFSQTASAQCVVSENGVQTQTLWAGQNIFAGFVSMEVVGDDLKVTYSAQNGWELTEAHFWLGTSLSDMPRTRNGNPKIGRFPYKFEDANGVGQVVFMVPLMGEELGFSCPGPDLAYFTAAHAALRKSDGTGGYQTETGWADGKDLTARGSWAKFFNFTLTCDCGVPACETAFGFGDTRLWDVQGASINRWGWQITVADGYQGCVPIYAGAGQNIVANGTHVGNLYIAYTGGTLIASFQMFSGFWMMETHLYVGTTPVQTGAPGQFGNLHYLGNASNDVYTIQITGDPIYVVAHAVVCENK